MLEASFQNQLVEINIKNFQSIKDLTVEFKPNRAHAIIGDNDIGKTAFLTAIGALCNNIPNIDKKYYVRDKCSFFRISGKFLSGHTITLNVNKDDNSDTYYEMTYPDDTPKFKANKLNGSVPPEIRRILNMYTVDLGNSKKERLNFRTPSDYLLMVDSSPGDNYNIFQKALKTEELMTALDTLEDEEKEINSKIKSVQSSIDEKTEELKHLPDVDSKLEEFSGYEKIIDEMYNDASLLSDLVDTELEIDRLNKMSVPAEILSFPEKELEKDIPIITNLTEYCNLIIEIESLENTSLKIGNILDQFDSIERVSFSPLLKISDVIKEEYSLVSLTGQESILGNLIERFNPMEESFSLLLNSQRTIELIEELDSIQKYISKFEGDSNALKTLENRLETLSEMFAGLSAFSEYVSAIEEVASTKSVLNDTTSKYGKSLNNLNSFMKDNNFCPIVLEAAGCPFDKQSLINLEVAK